MSSNYEVKRQRTIDLYNRSVDLQRSIQRLPRRSGDRRDRALARYYGRLRRDVLTLFGRSDRVQLIPGPVWCLEIWHVIVGLVLLASIILVVWLIDTDGLVVLLSVCFLFGMFFVVSLMDSPFWWKASPLSKVVEHAGRLHSFLKDYLQEQYPELEFAIVPAETAPPKDASVDYSHYAQRLSELQNQYDALSRRIRDLDRDIGMSIDSFRKGTLVEQRDQLIDERDSIADEMAQIERKLQGRNRR